MPSCPVPPSAFSPPASLWSWASAARSASRWRFRRRVSRITTLKEDATLAGFYLMSLAVGC
jgi:hypothetical protein